MSAVHTSPRCWCGIDHSGEFRRPVVFSSGRLVDGLPETFKWRVDLALTKPQIQKGAHQVGTKPVAALKPPPSHHPHKSHSYRFRWWLSRKIAP